MKQVTWSMATAFLALTAACPAPRLTPVTVNPESACRFMLEIADKGADSFPPFSFSPGGRYLVASADPGAADGRRVVDGSLWIYDLDSASRWPVHLHGTARGGYYYARWAPDGQSIAVATAERIVMLNNEGEMIRTYSGPMGVELSHLAFSTDGKTLAVSANDSLLFFIDLQSGNQTDGDVFHTQIVDIEPDADGFVVFHQHRDALERSFITPGGKPQKRPDVVIREKGTLTILDDKDVIVHDSELGARLIVGTDEHLLLPGIRGGSEDLLVNAEAFRLSPDRRRLAFAKILCAQGGCSGTLRVMQCQGLPGAITR